MPTTETNKPAATIRYLGVKAVIWANAGKDGKPPRYTVNYIRSYTDESGNWHDTTSLSETDNLKIGHVVTKVAGKIAELKAADRADQDIDEAA